MVMSLAQMLPLLRCPRSGTSLHIAGDTLVSEKADRYPIVNGKPVLVRQIERLHTTAPEASITSRNIDQFTAWPDLGPDARVLHLGSGDVPAPDPRVISVDVLPSPNVDIVAEAEALPFRTGSFDLVVSGAVFEHIAEPVSAAEEVRRVLREGGRLCIDTAFMQPYHGFPGHYFNMTPQAVETFLVDGFILEHSSVPDSGTVLQSIIALVDRFLQYLPEVQRSRLNKLPLERVLAEFRQDTTHSNPLLRDLPEHVHRAMAASFVVVARKPAGYDSKTAMDNQAKVIRRAYYTSRVAVMWRHSEACYYARAAGDSGGRSSRANIPPLPSLLAAGTLTDPTDLEQVQAATRVLEAAATSLIPIRDQWIREYLALTNASA